MLFVSMLATLNTEKRSCAEMIFEENHKLIFEIAYKVLNNREDAEYTLNEVMINVIKNIDRFIHVNRNEIEAQLVIYSKNAMINLYNKNKIQRKHIKSITYINDDGETCEMDITDMDADVEEIILAEETAEILKKHSTDSRIS